MRRFRLAVTLCLSCIALLALSSVVQARPAAEARPAMALEASRLDQTVQFSRLQTVTLLSSSQATATQLTTLWENAWVNVNFPFGFPLPADYMSVSVSGGAGVITTIQPITNSFGEVYTKSISLTPSPGQVLRLIYATNSRAVRDGNTYRIVFHATTATNTVSSFQTALAYASTTYNYVGFLESDDLPIADPVQSPNLLRWGPVTLDATGGKNDKFDRDIILADSRLHVDLVIQSPNVSMAPDRRSVTVTAVIANAGSIESGSLFFIEFYDRKAGAPAPSDPFDHLGGSCPNPQCIPFRGSNLAARTDQLWPTQTMPVAFHYAFHTGGFRDLYLQVDTYGTLVGLVPETNESNNVVFLATVQGVGYTYLPIMLKNR